MGSRNVGWYMLYGWTSNHSTAPPADWIASKARPRIDELNVNGTGSSWPIFLPRDGSAWSFVKSNEKFERCKLTYHAYSFFYWHWSRENQNASGSSDQIYHPSQSLAAAQDRCEWHYDGQGTVHWVGHHNPHLRSTPRQPRTWRQVGNGWTRCWDWDRRNESFCSPPLWPLELPGRHLWTQGILSAAGSKIASSGSHRHLCRTRRGAFRRSTVCHWVQ